MAFVGTPFEHDIFVSYSHGDPDGADDSTLKAWSQGFARELEREIKLDPALAGTLKIFLDEDHRPSQGIDPLSPLTDQLRNEIGNAAILTVLMSPWYLKSKWCQDERQWWYDRQPGLGLQADGRIAVVRILPTDQAWPAPLVDVEDTELLGFRFYDKTQIASAVRPYEWPAPLRTSRDPFRLKVVDLAGRLGVRLKEIQKRLADRQVAEAHVAKLGALSGQTVYLHGRADRAKAWDRAFDALSNASLAVVPTAPDPVPTDPEGVQRRRRQRVEIMSGCDALLLIATEDGDAADADLVVIGRQDRNSARATPNRPLLPCALLDTVGAAIATQKRRTTAQNLNVKWIDTTGEPWTPAVQQWLHDTARAESQP